MRSGSHGCLAVEAKGAALWIAAVYVVVGATWILLSDHVVGMLTSDPAEMSRLQTAKGWLYVGATGVLLYLLILGHLAHRLRAGQSLRDAHQALETLVQALPIALLVTDPQGIVQRWHPAAEKVLGWTEAEALGRPIRAVLDGVEANLGRVLRGESFAGIEVAGRRKDGSRVDLSVSMAPLYGAEGTVTGVVCVAADVTRRKQAEAQLQAAHEHVLEMEQEKKAFYREVIRAITHDKLRLADADAIPTEGSLILDEPIDGAEGYWGVRKRLREAALKLGMTPEAAADIEMAAGEAMVNAAKHAVDGRCAVYTAPDRIIARISDRGKGIRAEDLPATILLPGFSTKVSLGMGYTMMLSLADRVWLATGPEGTVVQVEKWVRREEQIAVGLAKAWG
ncbi:MAG: PAS domain S-box protein [Armatimonadota bacterium]